MIPFEPDTLYDWLADYESFSYAFKRHCVEIVQAFGLSIGFDSNTLKLAHQKWADDCEIWRTQHFPNEADYLSHAKVVALLLHNLSTVPYIARIALHDYTSDVPYSFCGTREQLAEAKADLIAAREVVLALDFSLNVLSWYEQNRIDRKETFSFRLTPALRHDILSYLVSRQTDPKAIYLILEALFVRTPVHVGIESTLAPANASA